MGPNYCYKLSKDVSFYSLMVNGNGNINGNGKLFSFLISFSYVSYLSQLGK